jgi:hypothetical protein
LVVEVEVEGGGNGEFAGKVGMASGRRNLEYVLWVGPRLTDETYPTQPPKSKVVKLEV